MRPNVECTRVQEAIRAFAAGRCSAGLDAGARAHLDSCGECRADYEASVRVAATLGRRRRTKRLEAGRRERRETQRRLALSVDAPRGHRQRGYRLRTLLLPAFFFALMVSLARGPFRPSTAQGAELECLAGEVAVRGGEPAGERMRLSAGESCATGEGARALLRLGGAVAELSERTMLVVEALEPARLVLAEGEVRVEGACVLVTPGGVVRVDGRARVPARGAPACLTGSLCAVDASGARVVRPDLRKSGD